MRPQQSRPIADEKLKPATKPAPTLEDRPRELLYKGRKKGGTKRGKVASAPAKKSIENRNSRKRRLTVVLVAVDNE